MSRYIVTPILSPRNIPYYVVTDTATGQRVRAYDCELWARHEAKELNRKHEGETDERRYHTTSL